MYADDTQLYTSAHPDNLFSLLLKIQNCCDYVGICLFVCLIGFLTSSSPTRFIADGPQDRASDNFMCCHTWDRAGRPWLLSQPVTLLLTLTQPVGSGRPQQESNPGRPHQDSALYGLSYHAPNYVGIWDAWKQTETEQWLNWGFAFFQRVKIKQSSNF